MRSKVSSAAKLLISKKLTLAFAESATAGRASAEFSLACEAGRFLKGGLVCYDALLKTTLLGVPKTYLEKYTPESMEVTKAITDGLSRVIAADIHVGITGLPCSGGSESREKPVGTMFIYATLHGELWFSERLQIDGNHLQIVEHTIERIAQLICDYLAG